MAPNTWKISSPAADDVSIFSSRGHSVGRHADNAKGERVMNDGSATILDLGRGVLEHASHCVGWHIAREHVAGRTY